MPSQYALLLLLLATAYAQKVILISFDGFRHDYIEKAKTKNASYVTALERIASEGFRAMEVESVMVSLTFPSHYALATGRYVDHHGLVGNTFYDPDLKKIYKYTDADRQLEPEWFTMNKNEPIWLTNQRAGGNSTVFYWPGSDSRMYGSMEYVNFGLYSGAPSLKYRIDRVMDWIEKPEVNLVCMYYDQPDKNGHSYGPDSDKVIEAIAEVNEGIEYLLQRLETSTELLEQPNIIITSDHGMTTVNWTKAVRICDVLDPEEYRYGYDISPATMGIWPEPGGPSAEEIYQRLSTNTTITAHADVYKKEDIPAKYHYKDNTRIAPVVVIAHLGYMLQTNCSKNLSKTLSGMHGYDNSLSDMHPFLIAKGPDIRNIGTVELFYQVDVYALVCLLLKIYEPNVVDSDVMRAAEFVKNLPSMSVLEQFDRYAKGLDPLPGSSTFLTANIFLTLALILVVQFIGRH